MEFNIKLQELRKKNNLSQEQFAEKLYVHRTAISKWESGRGYPSITSLKMISKIFCVSIDQLLSSEELISLAEDEKNKKENHIFDLIFGLLDISVSLCLFLPLFAHRTDEAIITLRLLDFSNKSTYIISTYYVLVFSLIILGIISLALQNCNKSIWIKNKRRLSLLLSILGILIFIISLQPYPAILLFFFLIIKAFIIFKK